MFQWFRDRVKNQRPWFRIDLGVDRIEGTKLPDGSLSVEVYSMGQRIPLKLNRESADKLSNWIARAYPYKGENVIQLPTKLSILKAPTDPIGGPDPFGG